MIIISSNYILFAQKTRRPEGGRVPGSLDSPLLEQQQCTLHFTKEVCLVMHDRTD